MSLGPLMIDIEGQMLTAEDRDLFQHPLVGGFILFRRNYDSPQQVRALISEVRALRHPPLLIAVDHEGGRVQRFKDHFSWLPPAHRLGKLYEVDSHKALSRAYLLGWLLATELRAVGVDLSFAPVLDLQGISTVIGERAFHASPKIVTELAQAVVKGMNEAGMVAVGKHFPGHGSVLADSHVAIPIDERSWTEIQSNDLLPFKHLIHYDGLSALMTAHVIYPQVDSLPATFSHRWLQEILRQSLGFRGVIFSDDMSMTGATVIGDHLTRVHQALKAGCDMILICNRRDMVIEVMDTLKAYHAPDSLERLMCLYGQAHLEWDDLPKKEQWVSAQKSCASLWEL